jgi:hypothetical protein
MTAIFISYRRDDSRDASRRVAERLAERFGKDAVFLDFDAIEAGADFSQTILDGVRAASVMLVVIGPRWLGAQSGEGRPRLEDPEDFVRREIETGLDWHVPIVPVLIGGASMPAEVELPASIRKLSTRQAHPLTEPRWDQDIDRLAGIVAKAYDVEPLPVDTLSYVGGRLQSLRLYPFHLAKLVFRPKRFLATRSLGRRGDLVDALVFFTVSTAIAVWLAIVEWPGNSWLLFVSGVSVGTLATLVLSIPLYLGWLAAGADREYGRVLTVLSYQSSVVHVGLGLSGLLFFMSINFTNPDRLRRVHDAIAAGGASGTLRDDVNALLTTTGWEIVSPYLFVFSVAVLAWMIASWGAYRRALGLSRMRSLIAFALTVLLLSIPVLLFVLRAATS